QWGGTAHDASRKQPISKSIITQYDQQSPVGRRSTRMLGRTRSTDSLAAEDTVGRLSPWRHGRRRQGHGGGGGLLEVLYTATISLYILCGMLYTASGIYSYYLLLL